MNLKICKSFLIQYSAAVIINVNVKRKGLTTGVSFLFKNYIPPNFWPIAFVKKEPSKLLYENTQQFLLKSFFFAKVGVN